MKVDGSLKSLIQGVSQQPARSRLPGQCTEQINMSSNPVDGLTRRPPLDYIAALFTASDNPQFYYTDHGGDSKFIVVALEDEVRVFDFDGVEKTVTEDGTAFDYLDGGKLAFTTLENQTYIANKTVTCAMLDNPATDYADFMDFGSIVYILGGQYARGFKITVNWLEVGTGTPQSISVTHTTPDGSVVAHGAQIATDYIATQLKTLLDATGTNNFNTTFTTTRTSDVLYINWDDSRTDTFEVTVDDGMGAVNIVAVNNKVSTIGKLPRYAPQGYHVTVTGDGNAGSDDWYLTFSCTADSAGNTPAVGAGFGQAGIWVETVKNKTFYLVDTTTMPHILEYDLTLDEFTFKEGEWAGRQVGDEDSNENPSFIDNEIEDIGYFQGRLVVLSGPAVIMSRTNKPLDFWIETATGQTDTDAIDIESTAKGVSKMLRVLPHNRDLVVFADNAQFIVFGRNSLTPSNSSLVLTTAFESNLDAAPVPAGRNIFFGINYGNFTGIREFYTEGSQDINDSRPITQHVLKYINGRVRHMASTSNFDTLLVQAGSDTTIYSYEYIWVDDQKLQSSWSKWELPNEVVYFFFVESIIYIVSRIEDDFILEKLDLDMQNDPGLTYQVKLDRKIIAEAVDTEIVDLLPNMPDIDDMLFVQGEDCPHPGLRVLVEDYDAGTNTITFATDMEGGNVICGQKYRSSYKPTMPFVRDADGQKVTTGKLVISKFDISTKDTGILETIKSTPYTDDVQMRFTGRIVGNPSTVVGEAAITDEIHTLPIRDNADYAEVELFTDSHLPLTMLDIEWVGQYTKRGKRITQGA